MKDDKKIQKVIRKIERKLSDIENTLRDISLKLCHVIKRRNHYSISEGPLQT